VRHEGAQTPRIHDTVRVEQQEQLTGRRLSAEIAADGVAGVRLLREQRDTRAELADPLHGVVARRVVDDDDLDLVTGHVLREDGVEAGRDLAARVVADDDHADATAHVAETSAERRSRRV
jgi:hypothetical protein